MRGEHPLGLDKRSLDFGLSLFGLDWQQGAKAGGYFLVIEKNGERRKGVR